MFIQHVKQHFPWTFQWILYECKDNAMKWTSQRITIHSNDPNKQPGWLVRWRTSTVHSQGLVFQGDLAERSRIPVFMAMSFSSLFLFFCSDTSTNKNHQKPSKTTETKIQCMPWNAIDIYQTVQICKQVQPLMFDQRADPTKKSPGENRCGVKFCQLNE